MEPPSPPAARMRASPEPAMSVSSSHRQHLVEAEGLTKRFPGTRLFGRAEEPPAPAAVDGVDLHLEEGEIFGLIGPNGAGKTTLVKLLTTLLRPTSGSARIAGYDVVRDARSVRRIVGLVTSNERSFYWRLSGRQNLSFFAALHDVPPREARRWIDELLLALDLREVADQRFDTYSTGIRQRFAFARGVLTKPRFLFMDEPTKGVDPLASAEVLALVRERIIERWRPTILITSHNLSEIERMCGRIALMDGGRFVAMGSLAELRALARPAERFELEVRGLPLARLRELAAAAGALEVAGGEHENGSTAFSVEFLQGSEGFARFVRGIVEARGDLLACTTVRDSFDDVFHKLLAGREARGGV